MIAFIESVESAFDAENCFSDEAAFNKAMLFCAASLCINFS